MYFTRQLPSRVFFDLIDDFETCMSCFCIGVLENGICKFDERLQPRMWMETYEFVSTLDSFFVFKVLRCFKSCSSEKGRQDLQVDDEGIFCVYIFAFRFKPQTAASLSWIHREVCRRANNALEWQLDWFSLPTNQRDGARCKKVRGSVNDQ